MSQTECLTTEERGRFLSGQLAAGQREEVELHLSRCRACRHLLMSAYEESKPETTTRRAPRWLKARALKLPAKPNAREPSLIFGLRLQVAGAIAAVLIAALSFALFLFRNDSQAVLPPTEVFRQQEPVTAAPRLLAPVANEAIDSDEIEFRWSEAPGAAGYTFTLLNERGDIVFQSRATEERVSLKIADAQLERGKTYFWYVAAKSFDGTAMDSEMGKFVLSQK